MPQVGSGTGATCAGLIVCRYDAVIPADYNPAQVAPVPAPESGGAAAECSRRFKKKGFQGRRRRSGYMAHSYAATERDQG